LSFEDEIAGKVVEGLKIEISPTEQKSIQQPITSSVEAYNDYLQARFYMNQYFQDSGLESLQKGEDQLLRATTLDGNFADAYALLGQLYMLQGTNFIADGAANLKRSETASKNALRIYPQSVEGMVALGAAYTEQGRLGDAIPILRQAVALAPNHAFAWDVLAYSYYHAGLNELAEQGYRRVVELNPTPPRNHWMHARMLLYAGRIQEAEQEMRETVAKSPDQFKAVAHLGEMLYYEGKMDEAETVMDRANQLGRDATDDTACVLGGFVYAARGERVKIDKRLFAYRPQQIMDGDAAYWEGSIYALLGDKRQALEWLRRTVELGDVNYPWFEKDKNYDSLRSDAEYQAIMADVRKRWETYKNEFDPGH